MTSKQKALGGCSNHHLQGAGAYCGGPKLHSLLHILRVCLMMCKGEAVGMSLPQNRHRQSLPNLSRNTKLTLATTSRSSEQQTLPSARRGSAQPMTNNYRLQVQQKQPMQPASKMASARRKSSPIRGSGAAQEQSPSSTVLSAKTNGTARQPSRLVAPSRYFFVLLSGWLCCV